MSCGLNPNAFLTTFANCDVRSSGRARTIAEATRLLTYPHDRATMREALAARKKTYPLVILRHAESRARATWHGDDEARPLLAEGKRQAKRLVAVLDAPDTGGQTFELIEGDTPIAEALTALG